MKRPAYIQTDLAFDEAERLSRQWVGKDVVYGRVVARVIGFEWWSDRLRITMNRPPLLHVALLPLRWHMLPLIIQRPYRKDPLTGIIGPLQGPWTVRQIRPEPKVFTLHSRLLESLEIAPQK